MERMTSVVGRVLGRAHCPDLQVAFGQKDHLSIQLFDEQVLDGEPFFAVVGGLSVGVDVTFPACALTDGPRYSVVDDVCY